MKKLFDGLTRALETEDGWGNGTGRVHVDGFEIRFHEDFRDGRLALRVNYDDAGDVFANQEVTFDARGVARAVDTAGEPHVVQVDVRPRENGVNLVDAPLVPFNPMLFARELIAP